MMKRILTDWMPAIFYASFLFYLSSLSQPQIPSLPFSDKILHLGAYAVLGFLVIRACRPEKKKWSLWRVMRVGLLAGLIYGATDEAHQAFVPLREPDFWDLVMDGLGGALGGIGWMGWIKKI